MYQKFTEFRKSMDSISYSLTTRIDSVVANCETASTLLNKEIQKSKNTILKELKSILDGIDAKQIKMDLEKNKKDIADVDELINTHFSDFEVILKTLHRVDMDEINKQIEPKFVARLTIFAFAEACKKSNPIKAIKATTKKLPVPGPINPS
jgi:hypothetical protein